MLESSICRRTVLQGESRHEVGHFGNFGRSRQGDDTLEIAGAPGCRISSDKAVVLAVWILITCFLALPNIVGQEMANVRIWEIYSDISLLHPAVIRLTEACWYSRCHVFFPFDDHRMWVVFQVTSKFISDMGEVGALWMNRAEAHAVFRRDSWQIHDVVSRDVLVWKKLPLTH